MAINIDTLQLNHSSRDSALRAEFEEANFYHINPAENLVHNQKYNGSANFFTPLVGTVAKVYDPSEGHYGVDIVSSDNQVIKAVLDGTVVYASWTLDFGYTIGIQHESNYLSNYKHNATLLKKEGDFVKAGEAIAILGASGELSEGPMLHFELWYNGTSMNPTDYINFEKSGEEN
jgi:murein DD-endopeptidase MepM/ murein hydrolase activator NlpD